MATFFLVRHAVNDLVGHTLAGRAPEVHLNAEGRQQAERLAERLLQESIQHIYSSPMERARETAQPLARRLGLEVEISDAFCETDFGAWTRQTVEALSPDRTWQRFNTFRSGTRIPDGELMPEVQTRFIAEMQRLRGAFPDEGIAIFSHGDPIRAAVAYYLGVPLDLFLRIEISPASVSAVSVGADGPFVHFVNETNFLRGLR